MLVAQRAHAFGMRLVAYDPFVSADRARQLGVQLVPTIEELVRDCPTSSRSTPPKTPETIGLVNADVLDAREAGAAAHQRGPGRHRRRGRARRRDRATASSAAPRSTRSRTEPTTESPLFALDNVVVTPHLGASTAEAQDKAGETIAEQVVLALRGDFVPFAVNVAASEASETVRPFLPLAERLGRLFTGLAGGAPETLEIIYEGEIADYDCRVLTLSVLKGVLGAGRRRTGDVRERAAARGGARHRGARDEVVRRARLREPHRACAARSATAPHVAGTLFGKQQAPRIVGIDEHTVDLPPSRHMLVVHNDDTSRA